MEVIPAIDVLGTDAVRLYEGDYDHVTGYGNPLELARRFAGCTWVHMVNLDGARSGTLSPGLVRALADAAAPAQLQASGGVRSVDDALALLEAGAARVVVGTAAWTLLDELVASLGDRLVVALDVRDGIVRTAGWTEASLALEEAIGRCVAAGVPRVLCTAIDRDGTLTGPDVGLVERVAASGLAVLAAGGIRNEDDLGALEAAGAEAAIVGRAVLDGRLPSALLSRPA